MANRDRDDFSRGERENFRGIRGNDEWNRRESEQQFGRGYEESDRQDYSRQAQVQGFGQPGYSGRDQRNFGSEGYPQQNFPERSGQSFYRQNFGGSQQGFGGRGYGQTGGYSEEGYGQDRSFGSGNPTSGSYGSYGRSQGVSGNWQQSGGTRGYGSEFGRGSQDFGGGASFGETPASTRGRFTGRGPKGYIRSDERIREDVSDRLEQHGEIDATEIEVRVSNGEVTLEGTVEDRRTKRMA
jgi:hypothetical protein